MADQKTSNKLNFTCKINFNLRTTTPAYKATSLRCIVRFNNETIVLPSPAKIEPRYWNSKTQKARNNQRTENGDDINEKLKEVSDIIETNFKSYTSEFKRFPQPDEFKSRCMAAFNSETKDTVTETLKLSLLDFTKELIHESRIGKRLTEKGTPYSLNTIKVYVTFSHNLASFKDKYQHDLSFENLNASFFEDFKEYLTFDLNYCTNTLGKHIRTLKTITGEARDRGISDALFVGKRYKAPTEESDAIYLDENELAHMQNLDLRSNPRLERVRDLFLVGCWTGLRFSDFTNIIAKNIKDGYIEIKTKKTGAKVTIPVHDAINKILTRYNGRTDNSLPEAISNQKMNEYLKELGEVSNFNELQDVSFTKGGKKIMEKVPKHKLITTHTARRSFATNMYNSGIRPITIMAITGHKTESSFMKYIKTTSRQHAESIKALWESRDQQLKQTNLKATY